MNKTKKHLLIIGGTKGLGFEIINYYLKTKNFKISVIGRSKNIKNISKNSLINYYSLDILVNDKLYSIIDKIFNKNGKITDLIFSQQFRGTKNEWEMQFNTSVTSTKNIIDYLIKKKF